MRVEQAEQAERARQLMALEQERHQQEMALRKAEVAKKRPKWMMAVTGLALALATVLVVMTVKALAHSDDAEVAKTKSDAVAEKARQDAEKMRDELNRLEANLRDLDGKVDLAIKRVAAAQTAAEAKAAGDEVKRLAREKSEANAAAAKLRYEQELKKRLEGVHGVCTGDSICRDTFNKSK